MTFYPDSEDLTIFPVGLAINIRQSSPLPVFYPLNPDFIVLCVILFFPEYSFLTSRCSAHSDRRLFPCLLPMARARDAPPQPLENLSSRHLGGWATPWSAEEVLDEQSQRVNAPGCLCQNCSQEPPAEKTGRGSLLNPPPPPPHPHLPNDTTVQGTEVNFLWCVPEMSSSQRS